jgi:hypothetical protein
LALFQAQPGGLGPFFRPASLSVVHFGPLNFSPSASLVEKMASSDDNPNSVNRP